MTRIGLALAGLLLFSSVPAEEAANWSATLERISSGVVSIRVDGTRAFDTEWNQTTQATGFVVDAERGLILTNRHVVMPGPVVAEAVFLNREEVDLKPERLNRKSSGKFVSGYIEFAEETLDVIDVSQIDLSTVGLIVDGHTLVPAEMNHAVVSDYNSNGIPDLEVKFDRRIL